MGHKARGFGRGDLAHTPGPAGAGYTRIQRRAGALGVRVREQERHVSVGGSKHPEPAQPGRKGRLDDAKDGRALPLQILCALHPVSKNW